jgi:large subunit ribosomal protein L13
MKTWNAKTGEVTRKWHLIDANGKVLGRLATEVATLLRGKRKPIFTPHVDTGDFVIVINAKGVTLGGNKMIDKKYYRRSRFFGSVKSLTAEQMLEQKSTRMVEMAVKGMLPKNKLARQVIAKLKVYEGAEHPHAAQKPQAHSF